MVWGDIISEDVRAREDEEEVSSLFLRCGSRLGTSTLEREVGIRCAEV